VNLRRLLTEMMRFCYPEDEQSSRNTTNAITETIRESPCRRTSFTEQALRRLEIALWHLGTKGATSVARDYLTSDTEYRAIRGPDTKMGFIRMLQNRARTVDSLRTTYEGLLLFAEMSQGNKSSGVDYSGLFSVERVVRLMRSNILSYRGAAGLLEYIILALQRINRHEEAVDLVQEYLISYPDDINVYEAAINRLDPEYAAFFATQLIEIAPWHSLNVDHSQYELEQQAEKSGAASVVCRLLDFLDYGTNKNRSDAWESLKMALEMIKGKDNRLITDAWNDRRTWWRKFHLKKTSINDELDSIKRFVIGKLDEIFESTSSNEV